MARREAAAPRALLWERFLGAAVAVGVAVMTLAAVYAVDMRRMPREYAREAVKLHLAGRGAPLETIERYARISDFSAPLGHYLAGLKGVALFSRNGEGPTTFTAGSHSPASSSISRSPS